MSRRFANQSTGDRGPVAVIKLDKSGGCVDRDSEYMQQFRQAQIREYFFGDVRNPLSPHIQQLDFTDVVIYRFAERRCLPLPLFPPYSHWFHDSMLSVHHLESKMLSSLLPGGETEDASPHSIFDQIEPSSNMQNAILAVVQADPNDSHETVRDASVIGFVYVAEVDHKKRKLRVLAPLSGRVPRRVLIWGHWLETAGELVG